MKYVEVIKVSYSKEESLTFSVLKSLRKLKEVWLMGSFDDETLKQLLQEACQAWV
jgi:hypothetical protein